jgi:glucosamine kinase
MIEFLLGVDGGGTGTRALLTTRHGESLGRGEAGPSALGQGVPAAWREVERAIGRAFESAGLAVPQDWSRCALGAGLSGINHLPWKDAFVASQPGFSALAVDTDGFVMLLGAHRGRPGAVVAAGTGSVGEVWRPDGSRAQVGGWGFPVGDEGSGAWLGLRAMAVAQAALDGRVPAGGLAHAVWARCGTDRDELLRWCTGAAQFGYAQLASAVFDAEGDDPAAAHLLARAVTALEALAQALDPAGDLPLALAGSIARRLAPRLAPTWQQRLVAPAAGAEVGALTLIRNALGHRPSPRSDP